MTTCPCCSNPLLRRIHGSDVYWFCRTCWQEMPVLKQPSLNVISSSLDWDQATEELSRLPLIQLKPSLAAA